MDQNGIYTGVCGGGEFKYDGVKSLNGWGHGFRVLALKKASVSYLGSQKS